MAKKSKVSNDKVIAFIKVYYPEAKPTDMQDFLFYLKSKFHFSDVQCFSVIASFAVAFWNSSCSSGDPLDDPDDPVYDPDSPSFCGMTYEEMSDL